MSDCPAGTIVPFAANHNMPKGWRESDGSRLRRREDPVLYDILRPVYCNKYRRWIVHLPDMRIRAPLRETNGGLAMLSIVYIIKTGVDS
jgi:microcystin-dependent protein